MKIVILHDQSNPAQEVPIDADEFSFAVPRGFGSSVRLKGSYLPKFVSESPLKVIEILKASEEALAAEVQP
jgi:hypothetical protein